MLFQATDGFEAEMSAKVQVIKDRDAHLKPREARRLLQPADALVDTSYRYSLFYYLLPVASPMTTAEARTGLRTSGR